MPVRSVLLVSVWLAACASPQRDTAAREPDHRASHGGESSASPSDDAPATNAASQSDAIAVQASGTPTNRDTSFDITARSDLPAAVPSTNRPYSAIVTDAVAPLRDALIGCMDRMPATARPRYYALVVETDGSLHARAPQPVALPPRVAQCAEGVIASVTIEPAPPRPFAHDVSLAESSPNAERSR
jgi:hypothetical protein